MTTFADLIEETKSILTTTRPDSMNKLNGAINNSVTSAIALYPLKAIAPSTRVSIDLEDMFVWAIDSPTQAMTLQRGAGGSTAATHADGSLIYVEPKFSSFQVARALNEEIDAFSSSRIFRVTTAELTYISSRQSYDIVGATNVSSILQVSWNEPGVSRSWPEIRSYRLRRDAETDVFPSGFAITLYEPAVSGRELRVTYASDFTNLVNLTDDVQAVAGIPSSCNDILPIGAAMRLSGYRETARNFFEGAADSRRASEVPPGSQQRAMQSYLQQYTRRIADEASNLARDWPQRRRIPA